MENPLLNLYQLSNDEFIPFDKIKNEHFEPAFEAAFANAHEELQEIIDNPEKPTFENTIEALERCSYQINHITYIFNNLKEAHTNPEIDRIAKVVMPQLAAWSNDLVLNEKLFARIKAVHDANPALQTKEQERLLETTYKIFLRNGALLDEEGKEKLREYDKELELTSQAFAENLLAATNDYQLIIDNEADLAGLPDRVREMAKEEARQTGKDNAWVFTLKYPSIAPFLKYSEKENLRKEINIAMNSRAMEGKYDNRPSVLKMVELRDARARLLGYKSHAHFVLENRMAKDPEHVYSFLETLRSASYEKAEEEYNELRSYKQKLIGDAELNPWDVSFLSEKVRAEKFNFNEEVFRSYFELNHVLESAFKHANLLYGISVKKREDVPVYHPDVTTYEILDKDNQFLGLLYFDPFPRDSKRNGGWIDALRMQRSQDGKDTRPHMLIVCNLTKPTENMPALLSIVDADTLFHEFGHSLHCFFSKCTYASLSAFNTLWDFVELPSQFMDSFLTVKESLEITGQHYQTGEKIPNELIDKKIASDNYGAASGVLYQAGSSFMDMKWHDGTSRGVADVEQFEKEIRKDYRLIPPYPGTSLTTSFKHIFNGGYDAGYYSYHWSEVLAADAFEYFKENGLFNKEIAQKFRDNILSKGGTEDPMELYKRFRGHEPDPHALLRIKGLE